MLKKIDAKHPLNADRAAHSSFWVRIDRALVRNGVSKFPSANEGRSFKLFDVGYLHVDVKCLTQLKGKRTCVYVGSCRATRYVFVKIHDNLRAATAAGFVEELSEHLRRLGIVAGTILSDNGVEWTDRYAGGPRNTPGGRHAPSGELNIV